jgi:hypothetical protein
MEKLIYERYDELPEDDMRVYLVRKQVRHAVLKDGQTAEASCLGGRCRILRLLDSENQVAV